MVMLVDAASQDANDRILRSMFVDRKRIFVDWLGWDVPHDGVHERDQFDGPDAEYLIVTDAGGRRHVGSVRLLRTDRPHILGDIFPQLCEGEVPRSPTLREATRLCVSPACPKEERQAVRRSLLCAMADYGLLAGLDGFTMLTEMSFLSRVAATGWRCEMLGPPRTVGGQALGALRLHLDSGTINDLMRAGIYQGPTLRFAHEDLRAA